MWLSDWYRLVLDRIMGRIAKTRTAQSKVLARPETTDRSAFPSGDAWARAVIVEAHYQQFGRGPTWLEALFAQAVARGESAYGRGWKDAGVGSNNWGAVQAGRPPCGDNAFPYGDTHEDGQPYAACFRVYATPVDGAADMLRILYRTKGKADARAAANSGSISAFSKAMRANGYYELRQDLHEKALTRNVEAITTRLGEPMPRAGAGGGFAGALLLVALTVPVGALIFRR